MPLSTIALFDRTGSWIPIHLRNKPRARRGLSAKPPPGAYVPAIRDVEPPHRARVPNGVNRGKPDLYEFQLLIGIRTI
jgi:hypothetical protein